LCIALSLRDRHCQPPPLFPTPATRFDQGLSMNLCCCCTLSGADKKGVTCRLETEKWILRFFMFYDLFVIIFMISNLNNLFCFVFF